MLLRWTGVLICLVGADNGLSPDRPDRRQAFIWYNSGILSIGCRETNFNEIFIKIQQFSFKKMHLHISSGKWQPFCLSLNVLMMVWGGELVCHATWYIVTMMLHASVFKSYCCLLETLIPLAWHWQQINGLVQERCNSSASAMELCLSCTNPSECSYYDHFSVSANKLMTFLVIFLQSSNNKSLTVLPYWKSYVCMKVISILVLAIPDDIGCFTSQYSIYKT